MIINEFIRYGIYEVDLTRLNRVRNHFKLSHIGNIIDENGKRIKTSLFNGAQYFTTKSEYGWRQERPDKKIRYRKLQ